MTEQNIPEVPEHDEPVIGDAPPTSKTLFSNGIYDKLKWIALVFLPALATAYWALGTVVDWVPAVNDVVQTIVVLDTLLGTLLGVSNQRYKANDDNFDGVIVVKPDEETGEPVMNVGIDSTAVVNKDIVQVRVKKA